MNKGCLIAVGIILIALTGGLIYYFTSQGDGGPEKYGSTKAEVKTILNKAVATGSIKPRLEVNVKPQVCLLYTSPSPRDLSTSRMPSSA